MQEAENNILNKIMEECEIYASVEDFLEGKEKGEVKDELVICCFNCKHYVDGVKNELFSDCDGTCVEGTKLIGRYKYKMDKCDKFEEKKGEK